MVSLTLIREKKTFIMTYNVIHNFNKILHISFFVPNSEHFMHSCIVILSLFKLIAKKINFQYYIVGLYHFNSNFWFHKTNDYN